MPKFYRQRSVAVTKYWIIEAYDFQNSSDCETFLAWVNAHNPGEVEKVERDFNSLRVVWNR